MSKSSLSIQEMRQLINSGKANDPLVFLEAVISGNDPRKYSELYTLVTEIDELSNGEVARSEWAEVVDYVITYFKYNRVTLSESSAAAKTLAEYMHPKRKQVESITTDNSAEAHMVPLTEDEIAIFREKFNEEF